MLQTIITYCLWQYSVVLLSIGALYKDDCKYQKYIPIYLIIGGSFGVLRTLWMLYQRMCQSNDDNEDEEDKKQTV